MPPELETDTAEIENVAAVDEADAAKAAEQSADAQSSGAEDVSTPEASALSVVRDVIEQREGGEAAAASSASGEDTGEAAGEQTTTTEPDNENFSDVPFNKHPRFQALLGELKTTREDAGRYKNVENYIAAQNLNGDEAADLLRIGGLIKTDPAKAWAEIKPTVQKLLIAAGEVLPDDLKAQVQSGEINRAAAMEISRHRAQNQTLVAQQSLGQQRAEAERLSSARQANLGAVSAWETERRARDPNFEAKMPQIEREIAWRHARGDKPTTPEGIKAQLQEAYTAVSASFAPPVAARPKPATKPVTGGQVNGNARPEVGSTMDAVQAVIARRAS